MMTSFLAGFGASLVGTCAFKFLDVNPVVWPKAISVTGFVIGVVCIWFAYN